MSVLVYRRKPKLWSEVHIIRFVDARFEPSLESIVEPYAELVIENGGLHTRIETV